MSANSAQACAHTPLSVPPGGSQNLMSRCTGFSIGLNGELTTAFHHRIELGRSHQHPVRRRRAPSPLPILPLPWALGELLANEEQILAQIENALATTDPSSAGCLRA